MWTFTLVWLMAERGWSAGSAGLLVTLAQVLGAAGRIAVGEKAADRPPRDQCGERDQAAQQQDAPQRGQPDVATAKERGQGDGWRRTVG